jgi:tetratricopeptide (TPR) repeat protein
VQLFIARGFSPGPRLVALLDILRSALPSSSWRTPMADGDILREIGSLLHRAIPTREERSRFARRELQQALVTHLYRRRGSPAGNPFRFLKTLGDNRTQPPDFRVAQGLLAAAALNTDQEQKLSRIWIALRELLAFDATDIALSEHLPLLNQALGSWAKAAAWYGLHAHIHLGCLAALESMADVREQLRRERRRALGMEGLEHPSAALGSALYSIAKMAPHRADRSALLKMALSQLDQGVACSVRDRSDRLAIRGSIFLRQFRVSDAISAYQEALKLRADADESADRIGEALAELGFAYVLHGRFWKGRDLIEQGVVMLRDQKNGTAMRARRKLAISYLITGRISLARREREQITEIGVANHIFDQLTGV